MPQTLSRRAGARALLPMAVLLTVAGAARAEPPLDPPRQYHVRADGALTVSGPRCCGATRFTGELRASYAVHSSGRVDLLALRLPLDDADVVVHDGFLGLFSRRITLRCPTVGQAAPAAGAFDRVDKVQFPSGALRVGGVSAEARHADGSCADPTLDLAAANDAPVVFRHDPSRNRFALSAALSAVVEGETYVLGIEAAGTFVNRPPAAALAIETPEVSQGSCPAYWTRDVQGVWDLVAQANDPAGLVGTLRSGASDPDGSGGRGDVLADRWFHARDDGPRARVGDGFRIGPVAFEWGPRHRVELLSLDHQGASAAAACTFRVVDTVAPAVTAPAPLTLGCSQPGGASAFTSPALAAFLSGAAVRDAGDASPSWLPPLAGGAAVAGTTLFAADGWPRTVTFRARDRWGNLGTADSRVTVQDTVAPSVGVALTPALLPASHKYYWVAASLSASDDCGGTVRFRLRKITSNAPAYDAGDVLDAAYGTDDRGFFLFARPAAPGVPRVYKVVYEGTDASGNVRLAVAQVVVG